MTVCVYVVCHTFLQGVNDFEADARALVSLLRHHRIESLINLIPFNPWPGSSFTSSSRDRIMSFARWCGDDGAIATTIRWPKGRDVMAACGQLATS